jgi:16S rRNA (cytosine967-C5)-methyltransferase
LSAEAGAPAAPALAQVLVVSALAWRTLRSGRDLDRALAGALGPDPDARLAGAVRDVTSHAVRRCALVEHILEALLHRPADESVRALLAVALAQLLAHSYAPFTLVDEAVKAARNGATPPQAGGLVNAVLREFLRRAEVLEAQAARDPARRWNVPPWWLARLRRDCGAQAQAVLGAQLEEPPLVLRVNRKRISLEQYRERLAQAGIPAIAVGSAALWLQHAVAVDRIPGFAEGLVSVQDAGAQLAAPWLGMENGMRVLDACAAPGGKTGHALEIADCRLDAIEIDADRARRIDQNLRRLGLRNARLHCADVLRPDTYWDGVPYDRILLDAPCTGSGVVRRHPDIPLLRRERDVVNLATRQAKMLETLWPLLAPTGRLLYVVCSVFAEEGRRVAAAFQERQAGARLVALHPGAEPGGVQLLPVSTANVVACGPDAPSPVLHDGFFYALLEKS